MFSTILSDEQYIKSLEINASKHIEEDRKKFEPIYKTIETFIKNNSFIISQPKLAYEDKVDLISLNIITIYCENIYRNSLKLVNLICDALIKVNDGNEENILSNDVNPRWLSLRTVVAHEEINIFYDGRPLIIFKAVHPYKNISTFKMLIPTKSKTGFFTNSELLILPPELELMDIYHKLYSPDKAEIWEELLQTEYHLFESFIKRKKEIIGGGKDCQSSIITNIETVKRMIVLDFIRNQPLILIGDWAIKLIEFGETGKTIQNNYEKLQIIIDSPIEDFVVLLDNFLKDVTPYKSTHREEKLHVIVDQRLKKYTFYMSGLCSVSGNKIEKPFLDVFNSGRYEIVPYRISKEFNKSNTKDYPEDIKIGNPYVILRFLLLDIWILRLIKNLGLLTISILETKINNIYAIIEMIKNPRKLTNFIDKVFQHNNYLGTYQSLLLFQKNKISEAKFAPYTPFYWKKMNNNYREA
jgi:hypothetical protein